MEIHADHLTKNFPGKRRAVDDVTCTLGPGTVGLLGDNGAGKTTLMRLLTGVLTPTAGTVYVDGKEVRTPSDKRALKARIGYLPQDLDPYPTLKVTEFLDYMGVLKGVTSPAQRRAQTRRCIEAVDLTEAAGRRIGGFSGGMRRRVGIAQALLAEPDLLVVDEPTAGLDPEERIRFRTLLADLGTNRTVIMSTHILDDIAQTCPQVCVMRHGRMIYAGETASLVEQADGYTWQLETHGPAPAGTHVSSATATTRGTRYRLVAPTRPDGAEPLDPTLEDGYVALMNLTTERTTDHR